MNLVTGGTGFLGSHLLRKLVNVGQPVRALYRTAIPPQVEDIRHKIEWVQGDVLDVSALEDAMQGVDKVYHCAGVVSFSPGEQDRIMKVNVEGTANVVNLAIDAGVRKLVHVSSTAALGRARVDGVLDESSEWRDGSNNSRYSVSKHLGEMEAWRGMAEGLDVVIVNPGIILGAGYWEDSSGMLIKNAWKEFPYYTEGINGFTDVRDVAEVMFRLMESDIEGERFVLTTDNWKYYDLFKEMAHQLGKKPPHIAVKPWMAEIVWRLEAIKSKLSGKKALLTKETSRTAQLKVYYSNEKILKALPGFSFTPLQTTIADMCRVFLEEKRRQG
ncbi:NAD-dependent epimerase/dehydratase family protein [Chitinophaga filiformis]|uniref:NAD-dependent epimerase/dehydratase family protein n=1 Tax=Chitinophaga filiformis TaxID=104663 RepID=A0ABY4I504_CHIFI|nr:NAD-dependent epimerase/dehydratase family protein [Chitinophaga filiformis]UPK70349.1 NAD-dependent epimerase/dehydratase family protein [Chitinophaga filiformis]